MKVSFNQGISQPNIINSQLGSQTYGSTFTSNFKNISNNLNTTYHTSQNKNLLTDRTFKDSIKGIDLPISGEESRDVKINSKENNMNRDSGQKVKSGYSPINKVQYQQKVNNYTKSHYKSLKSLQRQANANKNIFTYPVQQKSPQINQNNIYINNNTSNNIKTSYSPPNLPPFSQLYQNPNTFSTFNILTHPTKTNLTSLQQQKTSTIKINSKTQQNHYNNKNNQIINDYNYKYTQRPYNKVSSFVCQQDISGVILNKKDKKFSTQNICQIKRPIYQSHIQKIQKRKLLAPENDPKLIIQKNWLYTALLILLLLASLILGFFYIKNTFNTNQNNEKVKINEYNKNNAQNIQKITPVQQTLITKSTQNQLISNKTQQKVSIAKPITSQTIIPIITSKTQQPLIDNKIDKPITKPTTTIIIEQSINQRKTQTIQQQKEQTQIHPNQQMIPITSPQIISIKPQIIQKSIMIAKRIQQSSIIQQINIPNSQQIKQKIQYKYTQPQTIIIPIKQQIIPQTYPTIQKTAQEQYFLQPTSIVSPIKQSQNLIKQSISQSKQNNYINPQIIKSQPKQNITTTSVQNVVKLNRNPSEIILQVQKLPGSQPYIFPQNVKRLTSLKQQQSNRTIYLIPDNFDKVLLPQIESRFRQYYQGLITQLKSPVEIIPINVKFNKSTQKQSQIILPSAEQIYYILLQQYQPIKQDYTYIDPINIKSIEPNHNGQSYSQNNPLKERILKQTILQITQNGQVNILQKGSDYKQVKNNLQSYQNLTQFKLLFS